jgi:hypothetical protein
MVAENAPSEQRVFLEERRGDVAPIPLKTEGEVVTGRGQAG